MALQVQEELARVAQELRAKQRTVEELQGALSSAAEERSNAARATESLRAVLATKDDEIAALIKQKGDLSDLVHTLQTSLSAGDSKRQLELLQAQYDQVPRGYGHGRGLHGCLGTLQQAEAPMGPKPYRQPPKSQDAGVWWGQCWCAAHNPWVHLVPYRRTRSSGRRAPASRSRSSTKRTTPSWRATGASHSRLTLCNGAPVPYVSSLQAGLACAI